MQCVKQWLGAMCKAGVCETVARCDVENSGSVQCVKQCLDAMCKTAIYSEKVFEYDGDGRPSK